MNLQEAEESTALLLRYLFILFTLYISSVFDDVHRLADYRLIELRSEFKVNLIYMDIFNL